MRYPAATWIGSPNFGYGRGTHGQLDPEAIVYHIAQGTMPGIDSWFNNPAALASSHFAVGDVGQVHQYVELEDASWANGVVNKPDLSIPWLKKVLSEFKAPTLRTVTIEHVGFTGQPWPARKYRGSLDLTVWLLDTFDKWAWLDDFDNRFIGHYRIDSVNRSSCPGKGWPAAQLKADLLAIRKARSEEDDMDDNGVKRALIVALGGRAGVPNLDAELQRLLKGLAIGGVYEALEDDNPKKYQGLKRVAGNAHHGPHSAGGSGVSAIEAEVIAQKVVKGARHA